jgi:two-component system chemotaxis sensor kinase CheA
MTLPITLAIIQALIIETCGRLFAIPLNAILESKQITEAEISTVEKREVMRYREMTLPLIRLKNVFRLKDAAAPAGDPANGRFYVVVVGIAERKIGIVVERFLGQRDVVIKTIGEGLKGLKGIAGAAELGDQKTVLVLDVAAIINESLGAEYAGKKARQANA